MAKDYLSAALKAYWFAPPVALWRAIEMRMLAEEEYEAPMLDLGCGDGLVAEVLFGTEGQVDAGVDPWWAQVRRAAMSGAYGSVQLATGDRLPYPNSSFATVLSNSVLEHIPDLVPVVREVRRVLMPGGRFIFTVPSEAFRTMLDGYVRQKEAGDVVAAEEYASAVDAQLEHYRYYAPTDWRHLLSASGMEMVKSVYYIPEEVERLWDQMNQRYGVGRRFSLWGLLVSPRLEFLGYQQRMRRRIVNRLSKRWRPFYEMDVKPDEKGGGLLVVARRSSRWY